MNAVISMLQSDTRPLAGAERRGQKQIIFIATVQCQVEEQWGPSKPW